MTGVQEVVDAIAKQLESKWISVATAVLFMVAGWWLGRRRARSEWKRKEFFGRLNVSLNLIRDGTLQIRTILEKDCKEIFLNDAATAALLTASRNTTALEPIIPLPKDEYWYYLNAVLNEISEAFAAGQIRRDIGLPTQAERYLICLTNECAGDMKTRKLRAMLVRKNLLTALPEAAPAFESPHHATRWKTLQQLAEEYRRHPSRFMEVEIVM